jgi:hypothetical protein
VSALVHPNLYLNTVYITSCSLVGPEPYLRRHTMYRTPMYGSPQVHGSIRSRRVSPLISTTPYPGSPLSVRISAPCTIPNGTSGRSQISATTPSVRVFSPYACSFSIHPTAAQQTQILSIRRERTFHAANGSPTGRIYLQGRSSRKGWRDLSDVCIMPVNIFCMQHAVPNSSAARIR